MISITIYPDFPYIIYESKIKPKEYSLLHEVFKEIPHFLLLSVATGIIA